MIFQIRHTSLFFLFFLCTIILPEVSYGFRTDIGLFQKWEKRQENKAKAPFLLGGGWEKIKEVSTSKYAAAGANSGGVMEGHGETLTNTSTKKLKQALRGSGTKGRNINKVVKPLKENVKAAGGVLKKFGKIASIGDEAGNAGGFAGSLLSGDLVGAGEVVVNRSLAGASATAGGFGGGKIAAVGAILLGLNPPTALAVAAIGTVAGAVATSVAYDEYGKPIVSKTADDIEGKRSDWEAKERNRLGRIRADIHIVGLDEPLDPSISSAGRTSSTDAPVEDDLLRASNISDTDAEFLRKKAKEKLAKRQAEKKKLEGARKRAKAEEVAWGKGRYEETTDTEEDARGKKVEVEKAAWGSGGYEETSPVVSPAANLVNGIMTATQSCDYQRAFALANKALVVDPNNAWLKHNYSNIQLSAQRLSTYNNAYNRALNGLNNGYYSKAAAALNIAMNNASIACGQDKIIRTLYGRATEIEKMVKRESEIEKAKREGKWSASKRARERERYVQERELQKKSAQALHGVMLDALKAASQGGSLGNSEPSTGYGNSQGRRGGSSNSSAKSASCQRIISEMNSLGSQVVSSSKRHGQLGSSDRKTVQDSGQNLRNLQQRQNELMSKARSMGCL